MLYFKIKNKERKHEWPVTGHLQDVNVRRQKGELKNINKFTQKSVEAVQGCEKIASEYGNQEIEQEHLLYSLLTLDDSLILKLV